MHSEGKANHFWLGRLTLSYVRPSHEPWHNTMKQFGRLPASCHGHGATLALVCNSVSLALLGTLVCLCRNLTLPPLDRCDPELFLICLSQAALRVTY